MVGETEYCDDECPAVEHTHLNQFTGEMVHTKDFISSECVVFEPELSLDSGEDDVKIRA